MAEKKKDAGYYTKKVFDSGDLLNLTGQKGWGNTAEEDAKALQDKATGIDAKTLAFAQSQGKENKDNWDDLAGQVFGSPTGYVDQNGQPINPDEITQAQAQAARLADGTQPRDRPAGVPADAVRATANNGRVYWRYPGYGKGNNNGDGWITGSDGEWFGASPEDAQRASDDWARVEATAKSTAVEQDPSKTLAGKQAGFQQQDRDLAARFEEAMGQYNDPTKLFDDPDFMKYVGDASSSKAGQLDALGRLKPLTDVNETAAEKLMRMMAQQKQEQQLKGDREAMQANLKQRGVYGSGAELASQLGSQQTTAITRAQDELGADAQAQTRSIDALGKYSDLQTQMRATDSAEATFNKKNQQDSTNARATARVGAVEADNTEQARRAASVLDANNNVTTAARGDLAGQINTATNITNGRTGSNNATTAYTVNAMNRIGDKTRDEAAATLANKPAPGLLGF